MQLQVPTRAEGCQKKIVLKCNEHQSMPVWAAHSSRWEVVHSPTVRGVERAGCHVPMTEADTIVEAAMLMLRP